MKLELAIVTLFDAVYPLLSVTTTSYELELGLLIVSTPVVTPLDVDKDAAVPLIVIVLIVELFCGVVVTVTFILDAYFTILLELPVRAVVVLFVSTALVELITGFPVAVNVALTTFDVPTNVDPL